MIIVVVLTMDSDCRGRIKAINKGLNQTDQNIIL